MVQTDAMYQIQEQLRGLKKKYPRLWCGGGENQTITRNS